MIRVLAEAEAEIENAVIWYRRQGDGLGKVFKEELRNTLQRILKSPSIFPRDPAYRGTADVRRIPFRRFPWHVVYHALDEGLLVIAVSHDHREPGYWIDRV